MPNTGKKDQLEAQLAQSAPKNTPGQRRYPYNNKAARAIPDGGQNTVTECSSNVRESPILAVTK
jgi:hypothetical protein